MTHAMSSLDGGAFLPSPNGKAINPKCAIGSSAADVIVGEEPRVDRHDSQFPPSKDLVRQPLFAGMNCRMVRWMSEDDASTCVRRDPLSKSTTSCPRLVNRSTHASPDVDFGFNMDSRTSRNQSVTGDESRYILGSIETESTSFRFQMGLIDRCDRRYDERDAASPRRPKRPALA